MTTTIALAGKGGVGKTTTAGMIIKYMVQTQPGAILAIDADPSSNLNMVLGLLWVIMNTCFWIILTVPRSMAGGFFMLMVAG